jgi:hypothetical protein
MQLIRQCFALKNLKLSMAYHIEAAESLAQSMIVALGEVPTGLRVEQIVVRFNGRCRPEDAPGWMACVTGLLKLAHLTTLLIKCDVEFLNLIEDGNISQWRPQEYKDIELCSPSWGHWSPDMTFENDQDLCFTPWFI